MDFDKLDKLLSLSERLNGHPNLLGVKTLVDAEVEKMRVDSEKEVAKLATDRKAAADKLAAEKAHAATIHHQAIAARERLAAGKVDEHTAEVDKKLIEEDDKLKAEEEKRRIEEAKARGEPVAIPATPGPATAPPPHRETFGEKMGDVFRGGHPRDEVTQ